MKYMNHYTIKVIMLGFICLNISCKNFLDIDPPKNSLTQEQIFQNDDLANAGMIGIYRNMNANGFASGNTTSVTSLCGLTADEFKGYSTGLTEFYNNEITPTASNLANPLYFIPYQNIYALNKMLEGLAASDKLTPTLKKQLQGESLFTRAFIYFYLVNLYGPVPLQLTSDYRVTQNASRVQISEIYKQIITDLKSAEELLTDSYVTTERVRPNLATVQALLARIYLYTGDWSNAEKYASLVIEKSNLYSLTDLNEVFLKNSKEAIWQLMPPPNTNTNEGFLFIIQATPTTVSLTNDFVVNAFEENDKRKNAWIRSFTNATGTYYYPYKYKIRSSATVSEYSMVLRLAEQFLIRSEARAQQNNIDGAISDLDLIRRRAGLDLIKESNPNITKDDLLTSIQKERRVELFSEWGHRWFDLKRTLRSNIVLGQIKSKWQPTDIYYPIPQAEINSNNNITQNPGY